ncbi:RagB/SusD family nutrient uptake outer membrane protein [Formosa sp. 4Alg 33]|uniref:RagB/SusD family nutrient uptake outer membrane protein n=1 Tax=Formosa sp. 4Alg 33 TaxID=3382189 RepID=UPI003D9C4141
MEKRIIILGLFIAVNCLFTSCQNDGDFLDTEAESSLDESVIFSNPDLAKGAIDGILEPMGQTDSYRGRFIPYYGFNTDTEYNYSSSSTSSRSGLFHYDATPTNSDMNRDRNVWAMMYQGIERANICIRGLRTYGNPEPGSDLGQLLGEALTLRAVYYADLVKTWGDVPARFEPITSETIYLPKSNRDIIYKQILSDLGDATDLVAWPNESAYTSSVERINKAFVKSLRARIAMVAAGFQQYPDGVRRSNDPELSVQDMYTLALNEAEDVIASGKAHLNPSFEGFWRSYNQEKLTAGVESLWEIPFAAGRGRVLFSFAVRHRGADQHTEQPRGGSAGPLATVFYDYDKDDTRRDVTCVPYEYGNPIDGFAQQELTNIDSWYFGKYRYEWMDRIVTSTNDDGVNKIYMRYAEVLLIAAEASNELKGPTAAAPYLKEIRMRAFPSAVHAEKVDNYVSNLTSKSGMLDAIIKENKFEFTGEMERKQQLIRWNLLGENLAEAKEKMTNLSNRTGEYADVPTTLYYKYQEDGETLDIYGLERGEDQNPGPEYSAKSWDVIEEADIDFIFKPGLDPDNRQLWPIWQVFIDGSNGLLVNDYGY